MNFSSLGKRRLNETPIELSLHGRDLSETTKLDGEGIETPRSEERITAPRLKDNGASEKMFCVEGNTLPAKILERELSNTTKRRVQGRGSAAPLLDPRRADGGRANDRQDRGNVMDPRRLEGNSTLASERASSRAERSFAVAGEERDDERERAQPTEEYQALEQTKEKNMSLESVQEIVAQYKMALADLTVNSKIIITRLTIFAGDNIHAAKGIAATICAHILEVPSEQKLPSLYLLDSIVKNIGRDYVELFAAKLPEVFCEAYRQVDPSLHPKMKRLFETWREVFFGDPLLVIEEQLQFNSQLNSVISNQLPATKTAESPSPRLGHGIHVNPSYVEAQRQRMEQANRPLTGNVPKDSFSADLGAKKAYADGFLDYDYVCTDIGAKIGDQVPRRKDSWETSWHKEDGSLLRSTDNEFDKSRHKVQGNVVDNRKSSSRLLIDAYGNIRVPPVVKSRQPQRDHSKGRGSLQKSWEEESHNWDDKVPRSMDNERQWEVARKAVWFSGERGRELPVPIDKGDFRSNPANHDRATWHYDPLSRAANDALPDGFNPMLEREQEMGVVTNSERDVSAFGSNPGSVLGHQFPADRLLHGSPQQSGSSTQLNLQPFSFNPPNQLPCVQLLPACSLASPALNGDGPSFGFAPVLLPRPIFSSQSLLPPQVSALQPPREALAFPSNSLGHGNIPVNHTQLSDFFLPNRVVPRQPLTSFQSSQSQSAHVENSNHSQISLPEHISNSLPALPLPTELLRSLKQLQEHLPGVHNMSAKHGLPFHSEQRGITHQQQQQQWQPQQQHEQVLQQIGVTQQLGHASKGAGPLAGAQSLSSCNLFAALLGSVAVSSAESGHLCETHITTSLPKESANFLVPPMFSGQPQPFFPSSGTIALPTQGNHPLVTAPMHTPHPGEGLRPPLPPGPPPLPSQVGNLPPQTLNTNISTLLSSLVAQGLISTPTLPQPYSGPTSVMPSNQNMAALEAAVRVLSDGSSARVADVASVDRRHASLGFEFKTDVLRERQDFVINALHASSLDQCKICGLRCESQDALLKHMERHAPENSTQNFSGKHSRSWFPSKEVWVKGAQFSVSKLAVTPGYLVEQSASKVEDNEEPAVPADEDQAACTLCGEPFEDFYDDETDLWMYKGAVYLSTAPSITTNEGKGPIVHAKCRSTSHVPSVDILSEGLLSPKQGHHSLLAFQDGFTGHQNQEAGLESDQIRKRARY